MNYSIEDFARDVFFTFTISFWVFVAIVVLLKELTQSGWWYFGLSIFITLACAFVFICAKWVNQKFMKLGVSA